MMLSFKYLSKFSWKFMITPQKTLLATCKTCFSVRSHLSLYSRSLQKFDWRSFLSPTASQYQGKNLFATSIEQTNKPAHEKRPTSTNQSQLRRLYDVAQPEASSVAGAMCLLMISSSVTLSVPFFLGKLVDMVQSASLSGNVHESLQPILFTLSAVFVIGAAANMGRIFLLQMSGQRITKRVRDAVFSSIMKQEIAFFDSTRTGELINRLSSDVELVSGAVTQNISDGLRSLAQVAVGIGMMFFMSTDLARVVLSVVPPVTILAIIYGRYLRSYTKQTQDALALATQTAEEKISNIRTVRAFAKEDMECSSYLQHMEQVLHIAGKESLARSVFFGMTGLAGNAIMLLVLYNGGIMMEAGQISIGDLSAFLLYSGYVAISITGLSNFYSSINKSLGASARLWQLIDRSPSIPLSAGHSPQIDPSSSDIVFNDVTFSYPVRREKMIFNKLNLTIEAGKVTAVVGASGCGKTTLGSLLLRFYEPDEGMLTIAGVDLSMISPQWLRTNIGTVPQEPILFSSSVRDNIAYGADDPSQVSDDDIEIAARKANAYNFISQLPDGFSTNVGERGIALSGGQRQRVAIARALLKNPKILLLDEATSSLDAESEHLVRDALERVSIGRTTITIAHRLSTVKDAHVILVLGDEGRMIERGSYEELINIDGGFFRQLVEKQTLLL